MKSSIVSFFSGLIICVYVVVIGFFSFFVIVERSNGNDVALSDFQTMVRLMQDTGRTHGNLSIGQLTALKHHINSNPRIKAVLVENAGLVCFAHPTDSKYFHRDEMFRPTLSVSSPLVKTFSARITSRTADDTKFTAAISVIDVNSLLPKLKLVLTIVIAGTILCLCLIMYCGSDVPVPQPTEKPQRKIRPQRKNFISKRFRRGSGNIKMEVYNNIGSQAADKPYEPVVVKENVPVSTVDVPIENGDSQVPEDKNDAALSPKDKVDEKDLPEFSEAVSIAVSPPVVDSEKTPESYVEDCLDVELRKVAAKEQNLVLLRISIEGLDNSSEDGQRIAKLISGKYSRDNYIFDYDYNGYAVVLQDTELEQAISGCEELYSFLDGELEKMGVAGKLSMGLSCRSLRKITGGRLLREACAALEKAEMSDENPIVAFRANDAKYAQYVDESYKLQETT